MQEMLLREEMGEEMQTGTHLFIQGRQLLLC
jgi:hypothetical protein